MGKEALNRSGFGIVHALIKRGILQLSINVGEYSQGLHQGRPAVIQEPITGIHISSYR